MKNLHKSRISILLTFILISTSLAFFASFPQVKADSNIPEEDANNSWHWEVDIDDKLCYETEITVRNMSSGDVIAMFRDIWIYNISSIENKTTDWLGIHEFSIINATQCYYDPDTDEIFPWKESEEFAMFNYNKTDPIKYRYRSGMSGIPYILPINNSVLEVDILAPILNETLYTPATEIGYNAFDSYSYSILDNSILFENSTDNFYIYGEYYGNNGTLKYAKTYLSVNMGFSAEINATLRRVFDYDITDEVEWSVNVGDTVYYDYFEGSDPGDAYDLQFTISNITKMIVPTPFNSFSFEEDIPMVWEIVYANISVWNGMEYELDAIYFPMGAANNFYPMLFGGGSPPELLMIMPTSATVEDLEFMWNLDKLHIINAPLDTVEIIDNSELEFTVYNSTGPEYVKVIVDKITGLFKSFLADMGGLIYYEQKEMTLIDWSLELGNTFYYKINEDDGEEYIMRATIIGSYEYFVNMSMLEIMSGGLFTLPSDQPELQFFSMILADFESWNPLTETWFLDAPEEILGMANIYWPLCPLAIGMSYGFPLLYPIGVTGSDFSDLFTIYSDIYDEITYGSNYIILLNSTLDRQLNFYFDSASGRLTYLVGWVSQPGSYPIDWSYTSIYPLYNETLSLGVSSFQFQSDFSLSADISISINVTGGSLDYLYALLPFNPIHVPLPNGIAICFIDQVTTHPTLVNGNMTLTIQLPISIKLTTTQIYLFVWNMSGLSVWDMAPAYAYELDYLTNSIIIQMPAFTAESLIFALSYEAAPTLPGIPGFDPFFLIMGLILSSMLLTKIMRKKNLKIK